MIYLNEFVLIPRDETEIMCYKIIQKERLFVPNTLLDIGTGSGCILKFLLKSFETANGIALDCSEEALEVAKRNVRERGSFLCSDL